MSQSPGPPQSVSLKEHFESLLSEKEKRDEQRFKAQEAATVLALSSTKEALTIALGAVKETNIAAIEANRVLVAKTEEFADQKIATHNNIKPWVESLIAGLASRLEAVDKTGLARMEALERRVSRFENREEGVSLTTKIIMGAAGFLATLLGIYFTFHK